MLALAFGLLAVGSGVVIHVDDARGVADPDVAQLTSTLRRAIEARSGQAAIVDTSKSPCAAADRCLDGIRQRTESDEVVFLTLLGVPSRIRLLAERVKRRSASPSEKAEIDLGRAQSAWREKLGLVAAQLFPEPAAPPLETPESSARPTPPSNEARAAAPLEPKPAPAAQAEAPREPASGFNYVPWLSIGTGVAALAVGTGLGLSARAARDSAASMPHTSAEIEDLRSRAVGHGLAADILFGVSALAIGLGIALLLFDG
jgi:hypothetical protein